jgi:hypothetical protein
MDGGPIELHSWTNYCCQTQTKDRDGFTQRNRLTCKAGGLDDRS